MRNEQANLPRCLTSLAGTVDQLVVVDTGSTDRTVEIAQEAGADVFHFEWCDDFSAARNESLRHAKGKWILWIDADDELVETAPGALRHLCEYPSTSWGYLLDVHCPSSGTEQQAAIVRQWRLFPRAAGVRFEGRIHEHPAAPRLIRPADVVQQDAVRVVHWGYTAGGDVQQRKLDRNRHLIELCIRDEPHQPRHYFNLGSQLMAEKKPAEALPVLVEGIDRWFNAHGADTGYVPGMFAHAAAAAVETGQPETALQIERRTPAEFVSSDLLYTTGLACQQLGRLQDAGARWRRAATDLVAINNILADRACVQRAEAALAELGAHRVKPLVTACLIVKNEEADLPRCLSSVKDCVDEIVVVDTGSSDRTVEIAQSFGARTSFFAWCDDFSAARNASLEQATGDFILWVDADDELQPARGDAIRELCRQFPDHSWAYWVDVHCPTDRWQESETIVRQPRLFRNHPGSRFSGRLHEQLGPPPGFVPEALAPQDAFTIKHWGYIPNAETVDRRSERNRRILELEIAERPEDHFCRYNLGLQYAGEKAFALGLPTLRCAIELWQRDPGPHDGHVASMFAMAALCAVEAKEYATALEIEAATPRKYVSADLLYHVGVAHWSLGNAPEALTHFHRAGTDVALRGHNAHDSSTATWRPLILQAAIHCEQGAQALARKEALAALELAPTRPDALYLAAHAAYSLGEMDEARALCLRALAGERDEGFKPKLRRLLLNIANDLDDDALAAEALGAGEVEGMEAGDLLFLQARLAGRAGDIHRQQELLVEGCSRYPENHDIRLALCHALEAQGFDAQALEILAGAMDYPGVPPALYQQLARSLARQGRLEDAANALELASRAAELAV